MQRPIKKSVDPRKEIHRRFVHKWLAICKNYKRVPCENNGRECLLKKKQQKVVSRKTAKLMNKHLTRRMLRSMHMRCAESRCIVTPVWTRSKDSAWLHESGRAEKISPGATWEKKKPRQRCSNSRVFLVCSRDWQDTYYFVESEAAQKSCPGRNTFARTWNFS